VSYLIDTDIIIYSIKGNATVQHNFLQRESIPKSISVITYGELLFGARKSQNVQKNLAVVFRIKDLFPVLDVDQAVIEVFSELKAQTHKSGSPIDDFDLLIGSTALSLNLILVTNTRHFQKIKGLKTENWTKP